ncbi:hypothetical protein BDZ45DRAFT_741723 [Acephala macrosclerotiorum]|nr:hypothetical protein BDZ45DRAFT_741723 [Acephala macrosclerotiorum]
MAILDLVPGVSAEILVNGIPATEHPDTDEIQVDHEDAGVAEYQSKRTVSTYVESVANAPFAIKFTVNKVYQKEMIRRNFAKIGFYVTIDGNSLDPEFCPRPWFNWKDNKDKKEWVMELDGIKAQAGTRGKVTQRGFRFAKIETTGDSAESKKVKRLHQRLLKVGLIEIKVFRETAGKKGAKLDADLAAFMKDDERKNVPEKAIKGEAKSDCTALGEAKKVKKGDTFRETKKKDGEDYPLIIFRFMYRSREALRQLHIIERTPTPSPPPSRSPSPDPDHIPDAEGITPAQRRLNEELEKAKAELEAKFAKQRAEMEEAAKADTKRKLSEDAMKIKKEQAEETRELRRAEAAEKRRKGIDEQPLMVDLGAKDTRNRDMDLGVPDAI